MCDALSLYRMEISKIMKSSYLRGLNMASFFVASKIIIFVTVCVYVLTGNELSASRVFVAVSLYGAVRLTITLFFPFAIEKVSESLISIRRIKVNTPQTDAIFTAYPVCRSASVKTEALTVILPSRNFSCWMKLLPSTWDFLWQRRRTVWWRFRIWYATGIRWGCIPLILILNMNRMQQSWEDPWRYWLRYCHMLYTLWSPRGHLWFLVIYTVNQTLSDLLRIRIFVTDARRSDFTERILHREARAAPGSNWTCWGWQSELFSLLSDL